MISAQLSLFDTAAVIQPTYKVGDLVKLRKKPIAASYVKKGHIVEIAAIHPINGSIKFWNERSESWEFIHPDEIGSVVKPGSAVDSVTPAEVAVTESIAPPGNDDAVTPAEVAVTESIAPPGNDDLALKAISTYSPRGTARGGQYYRLSYRDGGRVRHQHIRGGNTHSPIAQAKVQEVRSLLAAGIAPIEIAAILKGPPKP
jgi:hypothetical protein